MLGGQSGAGKSYVAVLLAICLASGTPFFGRPVRQLSGVIYAAPEGASTIQPRLIAAKQQLDIKGALPIRVFQRFVFPRKEEDEPAFVAAVLAEREALESRWGIEARVLIVDTASASIALVDENSNAHIAEMLRGVRRVARALGMTIILVHHFGKDALRGLRGASAWRDNVDEALAIHAERNEDTSEVSNRRLNLAKARHGREGPISGFDLIPVPMGLDRYGEEWEEQAIIATEYKARAAGDGSKPKGVGKGERAFRQAFGEAFANFTERRVHNDPKGALVKAVKISAIREHFRKFYVTGEEGEAEKSTNERSAWQRELKAARNNINYGCESDKHCEWMWRIKD